MADCVVTVLDLDNQLFLKMLLLLYMCMVEQGFFHKKDTDFYVLVPQYQADLITSIPSIKPFRICLLDFPKMEDKYYNKFLLKNFLLEYGDPYEHCMYMDIDHIALASLSTLSFISDKIYVSSEVHSLTDEVYKTPLLDEKIKNQLAILNGTHYNNSLIASHTSTLQKIVVKWEENYRKMTPYIIPRFLEEVTFSLTVLEMGFSIEPVSSHIQSNWQVTNAACSLFHYGGVHSEAYTFKSMVASFPLILDDTDVRQTEPFMSIKKFLQRG